MIPERVRDRKKDKKMIKSLEQEIKWLRGRVEERLSRIEAELDLQRIKSRPSPL